MSRSSSTQPRESVTSVQQEDACGSGILEGFMPVQALQVGLGVREADAGAVRLRGVLREALPLQALACERPAQRTTSCTVRARDLGCWSAAPTGVSHNESTLSSRSHLTVVMPRKAWSATATISASACPALRSTVCAQSQNRR